MMPRRVALLALACLAGSWLPGCGGRSAEPPPLPLGSYSLDVEASTTATLPVWNAEMNRRADKEIADMVAQPPSMIAEMREKQRKLQIENEMVVGDKIRRSKVELTLAGKRRFELKTKIPAVKEKGCSGLWTVQDGELFLVRDTIDGEPQTEKSSLKLSIDGEVLTLRWPGRAYVLILRRG